MQAKWIKLDLILVRVPKLFVSGCKHTPPIKHRRYSFNTQDVILPRKNSRPLAVDNDGTI